jgi:hypothetical protein
LLSALATLGEETISFVISVRLSAHKEQLGSHLTDWHKILYFDIFRKSFQNVHASLKSDIMMGTLHGNRGTFQIIVRWVLLKMRAVSDKSCRETRNTHFMSNTSFFFENRAHYEIVWKNMVEHSRQQVTIWCGTCAVHARYLKLFSEYAMLIAFYGTNGYVNAPPCYVSRTYSAGIVQFPLVSSRLTRLESLASLTLTL